MLGRCDSQTVSQQKESRLRPNVSKTYECMISRSNVLQEPCGREAPLPKRCKYHRKARLCFQTVAWAIKNKDSKSFFDALNIICDPSGNIFFDALNILLIPHPPMCLPQCQTQRDVLKGAFALLSIYCGLALQAKFVTFLILANRSVRIAG